MNEIATTKMSSKGQVVIPESIRRRMNLRPGTRFVVIGEGDVLVLKSIIAPSIDEFDALLAEARRNARQAGLKRTDIDAAIREVRKAE